MPYDYKIALEALNDNDKNRLMCLYLNCDTSAVNGLINWDRATAAFGCASVESMKVMTRSALKKIENKGGKEGVEASPEKVKAPSGRKRKGKAADADGDEETPKKKGRGRKKKDEEVAVANDDDEEATNGAIKAEADDGFE